MISPIKLKFDYLLLICAVILMITGIFFIYSSGINSQGIQTSNEYLRQIIWVSIGLILMIGTSSIKYDVYRDISPYVYIVFLALIGFTLVFGTVVNGAKSWIGFGPFGIQPSEFMKIGVILLLAKYLEGIGIQRVKKLSSVLIALMIVGVPMLLVLAQPDLGTAMVFLPIALFMMYAAGIQLRYLLFIVFTIVFTIFFTMLPEWERMIYSNEIPFFIIFHDQKFILLVLLSLGVSAGLSFVGFLYLKRNALFYMGFGFTVLVISFLLSLGARKFLRDFQMMRLIVFLEPNVDPRGSGWNIIQSITAVGSGGLWGKGFLQGTQSHYQYLPEQSTDFIFSILSEEWGFLGGMLVSILYAVIIGRGIIIANQARDSFGAYIATGVVALFFFHFTINVGMTIGLMPITGIPLLLLSYGGSSLWTALISLGILMSVSHYRYKF